MAVSCLTVAAATTAKAAEQAAKPRPADPNAPQAAPLRVVFFHSSTWHKCQMVSLLESLCTAQVYPPTIVFLTRAPGDANGGRGVPAAVQRDVHPAAGGHPGHDVLRPAVRDVGRDAAQRLAFAKLGMAGLFAGLGLLAVMTG